MPLTANGKVDLKQLTAHGVKVEIVRGICGRAFP